MGDKENRLLGIFQKECQPLNSRNVQMVGLAHQSSTRGRGFLGELANWTRLL